MEVWPDLLPSPADAAIVAVALTKRYDDVATFDQKLTKRQKDLASPCAGRRQHEAHYSAGLSRRRCWIRVPSIPQI